MAWDQKTHKLGGPPTQGAGFQEMPESSTLLPPLEPPEEVLLPVLTTSPSDTMDGVRVKREKASAETLKEWVGEKSQVTPPSGDTRMDFKPGGVLRGRAHATVVPYKSVVAGKEREDQAGVVAVVVEASWSRHSHSHALAPSVGTTASKEGASAEDINSGVVGEDTPLEGKGGRTGGAALEDAALQAAKAAVAAR